MKLEKFNSNLQQTSYGARIQFSWCLVVFRESEWEKKISLWKVFFLLAKTTTSLIWISFSHTTYIHAHTQKHRTRIRLYVFFELLNLVENKVYEKEMAIITVARIRWKKEESMFFFISELTNFFLWACVFHIAFNTDHCQFFFVVVKILLTLFLLSNLNFFFNVSCLCAHV